MDKFSMTIAELQRDYGRELSKSFGEQQLKFSLLSPLFHNLYQDKIVYHHRFTCLARLSDIDISAKGISAHVQKLSVIRQFRKFPVPDRWHIQAQWHAMYLVGNSLSAYSNWSIWPDPMFVRKIENLIEKGQVDLAFQLSFC